MTRRVSMTVGQVIAGLGAAVCLALTQALAQSKAFTDDLPTNRDVLFWNQAERQAAFRMMDETPVGLGARAIAAGPSVKPLPVGEPLTLGLDLDEHMRTQNRAAVIVLHKGKLRLEAYGLDFDPAGRWTSFSVAKSITSTLVGAAIKDGYIESVDDDIALYVDGLAGTAYEGVTVAQLLSMTSGVAWNEDYGDPASDVAQFAEQQSEDGLPSIVSYLRKLPRAHAPGAVWNYSTGETGLVGILVQGATGKPVSDYLSEKLWQPLGMEQSATWLVGIDRIELGGCCIQASPRDFARFGQFVLDGGLIDGEQVVPADYLNAATSAQAITPWSGGDYGYQWWPNDDGTFAAIGIFGQSIFIDPARELVIVTNGNWTEATGSRAEDAARARLRAAIQAAVDAEGAP